MSARAREAEASTEPIPVEFNGYTYTVIPQPWPAKLLRLIEEQKYVAALTMLLGGERSYAAFEDRSSMDDIPLLLTAISEAVGADPTS
jgi:hypothetical protein